MSQCASDTHSDAVKHTELQKKEKGVPLKHSPFRQTCLQVDCTATFEMGNLVILRLRKGSVITNGLMLIIINSLAFCGVI